MKDNISNSTQIESLIEVRRIEGYLREIWIKINIEKIDTYKEVTVTIKILLNFKTTKLFIYSKFAK